MTPGTVFWITGLSGAGKSSLARLLCAHLRSEGRPVILLDGDELREMFGNDLGYSASDRLKSAMRNSRLSRLLAMQGMDVVIPTISLFHSCQEWNRRHIPHYREILVAAEIEELAQRDIKAVYRKALAGELSNVVGIDIPAEFPQRPDVVIRNNGSRPLTDLFSELLNGLFTPPAPSTPACDKAR